MPIVRMKREVNRDKEFSRNELSDFKPWWNGSLSERCHLLATNAVLRRRSSIENLERSKKLIEKSRQIILAIGIDLTKDD